MESLQSVCWREAVHYAHFNGWNVWRARTSVFGVAPATPFAMPTRLEVR